ARSRSLLLRWRWWLAGIALLSPLVTGGIAFIAPIYREHQAIAYLTENNWQVSPCDDPTSSVSWFRETTGFQTAFNSGLSVITSNSLAVTDTDLRHLTELGNLRYLYIWTKMTDAQLEPLQRLPRLEILALAKGSISDEGLAHVKKLRNL